MGAPLHNHLGKISPWFWLPPLAASLLIALIWLANGDQQIFLMLNRICRFGSDGFWINVMTCGDGLVVCVLLLPLVRRRPEFVRAMLLSWLLVALCVQGLKFLINTPRPLEVFSAIDFRVIGAHYKSKSFPSGHTATASMFAAVVCRIVRQKFAGQALIPVVLLIGISRVAMGIHWPTDVLAGFLIGWLLAWLGTFLAARFQWGAGIPGQVAMGIFLTAVTIMMLTFNYTDYPQAFRFQQTIAIGVLSIALADLLAKLIGDHRASGRSMILNRPS